jgi:hypothetical protein
LKFGLGIWNANAEPVQCWKQDLRKAKVAVEFIMSAQALALTDESFKDWSNKSLVFSSPPTNEKWECWSMSMNIGLTFYDISHWVSDVM